LRGLLTPADGRENKVNYFLVTVCDTSYDELIVIYRRLPVELQLLEFDRALAEFEFVAISAAIK
jgi:hypothetical protein